MHFERETCYNMHCGLVRRNERRDTSTRLSTTTWMSSTRMSAEMNSAFNKSSDRRALPHINIGHSLSANAFRMQVGFMDATWDGIYIMHPNVRSYLERPEELVEDLRYAFECQERLHSGDPEMAEYLKDVAPYRCWFYHRLM